MNSRSERKAPKKYNGKQISRMKSTLTMRTLVDFTKEPLYMYVQFFLRKKYIERQLRSHEIEKIRKLIFSTFLSNQGRYKQTYHIVTTH